MNTHRFTSAKTVHKYRAYRAKECRIYDIKRYNHFLTSWRTSSPNFMQRFVKEAQAGNKAAWNFLHQQNYPWLYANALRICGNCAAAKDAVQETFVQAYLKLNQLRDPKALTAWLKTTLVRNCQRELRSNFLHSGACENVHFEFENNYEDEINRNIDLYGQQTKLYETLSCMTDTLQSVLLLRYFSDWQSYEEIATILCIPVGTVRSRLNQAKHKLEELWVASNDKDDRAFKEARDWNDLYNNYFGNIHSSLSAREKLLDHFDKNLHLIFTSGKTAYGRKVIEREIDEDVRYGTSFCNIQVISSGPVSIVETQNINSKEYPDRCPDSSVLVLYRNNNKVTRVNLHNSH